MSYSSIPRVKICGITSVDDALCAVEAGADAIGLVFYEPSPRHVSIALASDIARSVGAFVTVVGLFVNADKEYVLEVLNQVPLHVIQFHGDETARFCEQFARPYVKAIRMKPGLDVMQEIQRHPLAVGVLLDAYRKGVPGGTGETFDWEQVPHQDEPDVKKQMTAIILAGGLNPDNIQEAVKQTRVYGVDVSGGVESIPGKKDRHKVINFVRKAKSA